MLDMSSLGLFMTASLALLLIPGPAVMYIVARSIDQGRTAGLVSVFGIGLGAFVHVTAAAIGLSALLMSSALLFSVIKYLGAAYLIYLGISTLMDKRDHSKDEEAHPTSLRRIFSQGVVVNVLNPKTALFFFAFLPQFVNPARGSVVIQILMLGSIFTAMAICTDGTYAMLAGTAGKWLRKQESFWKMQRYLAGGTYIVLGLVTATASSNGGHASE